VKTATSSIISRWFIFLIGILGLMLCVSGCAASRFQLYDKSAFPSNEKARSNQVAIIKASDEVRVRAVDFETNGKNWAYENTFSKKGILEVLPGEHTLTIACVYSPLLASIFSDAYWESFSDAMLTFQMEAGHTYRFRFKAKAGEWSVRVEDVAPGGQVVTLPCEAHGILQIHRGG
jgi:hypothetical protein